MADWTISISNSLNLFGAGPSSLWYKHNWGEFLWGEGTEDMIHGIFKVIDNSQSISDTVSKSITRKVTNNLAMTSAMTEEMLKDGSGYNYVFVKPSTDGEDRSLTQWSSADIGDVATYTCAAAGGTTWTEL